MAKLIYVSNVSLDGYIEDEHGSFDWTVPDDELFAFITDLVRPVGTYPFRPAHVRHDGPLGDRPRPGRPVPPLPHPDLTRNLRFSVADVRDGEAQVRTADFITKSITKARRRRLALPW